MTHKLRVELYSEAEDLLNNLIVLTNNENKVNVITGYSQEENIPYKEYEFEDEVYNDISDYLKKRD